MVIRAWNLFHGNTFPPGRKAYVREMVELITADRPGIVCLQEVPVWALERTGEWADMRAVAARTRRSKLGPLGRRLTAVNAGKTRSAFGGQGNVILLPKAAKLREEKQITLNTNVFCEEQATRLGLTPKEARRWESERRVCHIAKIELPNRKRMLIANLHATSRPSDLRLADAEIRRAASFVDRQSEVEETVILAGDFNVALTQSETLTELTTRLDERYSRAGPGVDHILVRGTAPTGVRVWSDEERTYDGKLLSDHAPLELEIGRARRQEADVAAAPMAEAAQPAQASVVEEPAPVATTPGSKDDDRWETPDDERWETPPDERWESEGGWETER
jgi:endonuclease/exonuclease/phosphatase family metal-dependent hydrolase